MSDTFCCGCDFESDYGTSVVTGDGSVADPFSIIQVDPLFNRPVVRSTLQIDRSIPNNTPTAVQWTGVLFDSNNMFSLNNDTRLTVQVAGFYLMGYQIVWPGAAVGVYKTMAFRSNGTTTLESSTRLETGAFSQAHNGSYLWYFAANEYVELVLTQVSGGALTIPGTQELDSAALGVSGMWMTYLGKKV